MLSDALWSVKLRLWPVVPQFEITPKTFANCSPGWLQPWVNEPSQRRTLKEFARRLANAFSVSNFSFLTQGCFNPGLQLANAFGVTSNCGTTFCPQI